MARRLLLGASNKPTSRLSCESALLEPLDLVRMPGSHLLNELLDSKGERLPNLNELHAANNIAVRFSPQFPVGRSGSPTNRSVHFTSKC